MLTPFCSYRKRASPLPKDDHSSGVNDCLLANSSDPVEMRRLNYQTPGNTSHTICTVDTRYQSARAPCVLHHMHVYTCLWLSVWYLSLSPYAQCTNTNPVFSLHTQYMHIIHCTISSVSCSVTLILFSLCTNTCQHMPPNVSFSINRMCICTHRYMLTELTVSLCNQNDLSLPCVSSNLHGPPTPPLKTEYMREEALLVITLHLKAR